MVLSLAARAKAKGHCTGHLRPFKTHKLKLATTLANSDWIRRIDMKDGLSTDHIQQFFSLWTKIQEVQITKGTEDVIRWNSLLMGAPP